MYFVVAEYYIRLNPAVTSMSSRFWPEATGVILDEVVGTMSLLEVAIA